MKTKYTFLLLLVGFLSCTLDRREHQARMSQLLDEMAPLAKQALSMQKNAENQMHLGLSLDPAKRAKYNPPSQIDMYQNFNTIAHKLAPFTREFQTLKYQYIQSFGVKDYNDFISKKGLEWGLGTYW